MKVKIKPGGQSPVQEATLMWLAYYGKPGVHFQLEIVMNDGAQAILEGLQMHSEHCWQVIRSNVTEQKQNLEHRAGDELTLGVAFDALRCVMGFDFPVAAALAFEDEYDEDEIPLSEHTPLSSLPFGAMVSDVSKGYQLRSGWSKFTVNQMLMSY